jgi:hypothetical protein
MIRVGLIASLAVLAACAKKHPAAPKPSPTENEAPSEDVAPTATEPAGYQYSEDAKSKFLDGCLEESDAATCDCLLGQVQQRYSEEYLDTTGMEGLTAEEVEEIVAPCRSN